MDPVMATHLSQLVWHAFLLGMLWAPFAVAALLVEHWRDPIAREIRSTVLHPIRAAHEYRLAHAH